MGRTVPTYRLQLDEERRRWRQFRAALRVEDQVAFDNLFVYTRTYADAGSAAARACPSEALFMSILIGLYQEVQRLRHALVEAARRASDTGDESIHDYIRRIQAEL
jgi:hypothetical protein